jgi:outer membrane protein assembly factor BamD
MKRYTYIIILLISAVLYSCSSASKSNINTDDPERALAIAMKSYNEGDYLQSIEDFSLIKLKFSGTTVADKAQYYLAMSHYKREEYILAAYEFEMYIKNYPSGPEVINAAYNLAMCYYGLSPVYNLDQTYTKLAISQFQLFLELFPDNQYTSQAESRIKELRTKLALKAFASGNLYMDMDDYRAAIVYYDYVLNDYFDTEYADDAALGKIQALIKRKKYAEAAEEVTKFETKFKDSPLLGRVRSLKSEIASNLN